MKQFYTSSWLLFLGLWLGSTLAALAQNGPSCSAYTNRTTANGLGSNLVRGVYAVGSTVYAATGGGLSISTNGGTSFTNRTTADGLGNNSVIGVYAVGNTVYAATFDNGLSISTNGGTSFTNRTTADGLGSNTIWSVYALGSTVYAATGGGLSISTNGGTSFTNYTTADGLGSNTVRGVYAVGSTVYVATDGGLSISTNGGTSFTNYTTADGLGGNLVLGVYAVGSTVYAATNSGLSISTNGGTSFTIRRTISDGLGGNALWSVYAVGSTVYVSVAGGLSISTNGGTSFTNYTIADGLGGNLVYGVSVVSSTVYAATLGGLSLCSASLPVRLTTFTGQATSAGNRLTWQTSWETDNNYFLIERATDARTFEPIGKIASQAREGNSNHMLAYQFTDLQPPIDLAYYRLQQVDFSGTRTLSSIIAIRSDLLLSQLYPNPVGNANELVVEPSIPFSRYRLLDALGRVVQQSEGAGQLSRLHVSSLPPGHYVLVVEKANGSQIHFRLVR